jgi:hypothetical protein
MGGYSSFFILFLIIKNMGTESIEGELNPEEQMVFNKDVADLTEVAEQRGISGLDGRVMYGLDPAGMMAVRDTAPLVKKIAIEQGTSFEEVWPLIIKLHKEGPWGLADKLKEAIEPQIRVYLVLATACHESTDRSGYTSKTYLEDRRRVISELQSFSPEKFESYNGELSSRVNIEKVMANGLVPVATGDVALLLSVQGYRGCVSKGGEMRFAQTTNIDDVLLEQAGLVKGFAEVYNPAKDDFDRIPFSDPNSAEGRTVWVSANEASKDVSEMEPVVKRIAPGYVLCYKNEELAVNLVAESIGA